MSEPITPTVMRLRLRPPSPDDFDWMAEMACDPALAGEHNWDGEERHRAEVVRDLEERYRADTLVGRRSGTLVVELDDGTAIGDVGWRAIQWGPSERSTCPSIGIALLPAHRGRGHGTVAQRLLVDHLFRSDELCQRVQADTAADNPGEQRALEKVGMTLEGMIRDAEYRGGRHHDHLLYSMLRSEWVALVGQGYPA